MIPTSAPYAFSGEPEQSYEATNGEHYTISEHGLCGWVWAHVDYDGDEDRRCGHEMSYQDCVEAIDEEESGLSPDDINP